MQVSTIGIDLAKNVFQVHGVDGQHKVVLVRSFVTVTGYTHEQRPPAFADAPVLSKPVRHADLIALLRRYQTGS